MRRDDRRLVLGLHRINLSRDLLEAALACGINEIDTAYNYADFAAHRILTATAGHLLAEFAVSTKVGFFPVPSDRGAVHSLDPARLRTALARAIDELGTRPAVVFLHNPERSLASLPAPAAWSALDAACAVLAEATSVGWCRSWGISTWDSATLWSVVGSAPERLIDLPQALMLRCGLLVKAVDAGLNPVGNLPVQLVESARLDSYPCAPVSGEPHGAAFDHCRGWRQRCPECTVHRD